MISIGGSLDQLNKHASSRNNDSELVINRRPTEVDTKMSYRYKDSQTQPSSLPRRYFSLPKNYSSKNSTHSKDSSPSTRYRSISSSSASTSTTPSSQPLRYGSLRTYGASTSTSVTEDLRKPTSRRLGTITHSSSSSRPVGISSNIQRKSSYPSTLSTNLRDLTPSYTARHVSSIPHRSSGSSSLGVSHDSNWSPGDVPVRQRSSISLRETQPVWGPNSPPTRQYSSGSLRDSPFTLPSRRTYSSTQGTSDTETYTSSRRKTSPIETEVTSSISPPSTVRYGNYSDMHKTHRRVSPVERTSTSRASTVEATPTSRASPVETTSTSRASPVEMTSTKSISPPTVQYQGSESKEEKPASPKSPIVQYSGSIPRKDSPSSRSEASTTSSSRRGSSGSQGGSSDDGNDLESCAARDISLLSREIATTYEGSLSRSDSRRQKGQLQKQRSISDKEEKTSAKETKANKVNLDKKLPVSNEKTAKKNERTLGKEKNPGRDLGGKFQKGHKRSASTGSASGKDGNKKSGRKFPGVFSRKMSRESTDSEGEEERSRRKNICPNKGSKDSVKDVTPRRGSSSSAHSVSPPVTPPKRKISGPGRFFSYSSDSKTTPELPKKFSVPGKFFTSKDAKSGGESSDLDSETGRSRPNMKRRVSLPGMLGFPRSSSKERATAAATVPHSPEPAVDPDLLKRRRSNFKKAQTFDAQSDTSKNSMLSKLKFWDHSKKEKSPDSRTTASTEESRSRSLSANSTEGELEDKMPQSRKDNERTAKKTSLEMDNTAPVKPESKGLTQCGEKNLQVSAMVTHSAKGDESVRKNSREAKVLYVGPVGTPSPSEERARKRAQYKVKSDRENKSTVIPAKNSTVTPAENSTDAKKPTQVEENANDSSTRDTVSKLRERRRRRREDRERFFAGLGSASKETSKAQVAEQNNQVQLGQVSGKDSKTDAVGLKQDKIDGRRTSENANQQGGNNRRVEPAPKLRDVGKRSTVDDVLQKGSRVKGGKPRYQTIASSVHADIIADLIREKGLNSTTKNEIKIPSVAELRSKFLISKDDGKVSPTRIMLKLDDRPNSVSGEVLSPTEMKKFDDISFSLAKKVSSDDMRANKFSDSSSDSLPKLDTKWKTIPKKSETSPPASPKVKDSSKNEKKVEKITNKEKKETDEQDGNVDSDTLKRKRGSKKKRKKSIFGTDKDKDKDKEVKTPEEEDTPQHGAVSAAIKAMFTRKSSVVDKTKTSRKQRTKSTSDSTESREIIKTAASDRERKKSAPEQIAQKLPVVVDAPPPAQVERKDSKVHEKTEEKEEAKEADKEKDIELHPISELEQKPKERKSLKKRKCIRVISIIII